MTQPTVSAAALKFLLECAQRGEGRRVEILFEERYAEAEELVDAGLMTHHHAFRVGDNSAAVHAHVYRLERNGRLIAAQVAILGRELSVEAAL